MTDLPLGVTPALARLYGSIRHLVGRPTTSPYNRLGIVDLTHAYSNLWTEVARSHPHAIGRLIAWSSPVILALAIYAFI